MMRESGREAGASVPHPMKANPAAGRGRRSTNARNELTAIG